MLAFHSAIYYAIGQQKGDAGQATSTSSQGGRWRRTRLLNLQTYMQGGQRESRCHSGPLHGRGMALVKTPNLSPSLSYGD